MKEWCFDNIIIYSEHDILKTLDNVYYSIILWKYNPWYLVWMKLGSGECN